MTEIFISLIFIALLINYLYFLSNILRGLKNFPSESKRILPDEFVTVIIPFRNESEHILDSLNSLQSQDYPADKFEVIYVNDSSDDGSYEKILNAPKPANIRVINMVDKFIEKAFKKKAVSFGIEHSIGEIIVTTDADCTHNKQWLNSLLKEFNEETGFVSGPVSFNYHNKFFSRIQALEFGGLILSGAGLIGINKPAICNGANLAFRKSLFLQLHGYSDQMHLSSGEDEILMQKIANETNSKVKFAWEKDAVVSTNPNKNLKGFMQQRTRWASKGVFYHNNFLVMRLSLVYFFFLGLFLQLILSVLVSKIFLLIFFISVASKFYLDYRIMLSGSNFLFEKKLLKYFIPAELFQISYISIVGISGAFGNFKWKDRKLKR